MQSERDRTIAKICELIIECGSPPDRLFPARKGPQVQDVEKRLQAMSRTLLGKAVTSEVWNDRYGYRGAESLILRQFAGVNRAGS